MRWAALAAAVLCSGCGPATAASFYDRPAGGGGGTPSSGLLYSWDLTAIDSGTTWNTTGTKSLGGLNTWNVRNAGSGITVNGSGLTLTPGAELTLDDITEVVSGFDGQGKMIGVVAEYSTNFVGRYSAVQFGRDYSNLGGAGCNSVSLEAYRKTLGVFAPTIIEGGYVAADTYALGFVVAAGTVTGFRDESGAPTSAPLLPLGTGGATNWIGGKTWRVFDTSGGLLRLAQPNGTSTLTAIQFYDLTGSS